MDSEAQVRLAAARAVGYAGNETGALLLRMKILGNDAEPQVTAECFAQLVKLEPASRSLPFVQRFVDSSDEVVRQAALLALGASRDPQALRILTSRWESNFGHDARALLIPAIVAHRSKEAIDFLIESLDRAGTELAGSIIEGLAAYRHDAAVVERVRAVVAEKDDGKLDAVLQRRFAD